MMTAMMTTMMAMMTTQLEPTPSGNAFRGVVSSSKKLFGHSTIYGRDGDHMTPYMTRLWIGRLRLHIFHRGDADPDPHDHPWGFWTFPLTPYKEEIAVPHLPEGNSVEHPVGETVYALYDNIVPAFAWTYRPASHTHRVIGHADGSAKKLITFVWREKEDPDVSWGFLKNRNGEWCWVPWKEYIFGGGKDAPCS
jgi:hypothetical protein